MKKLLIFFVLILAVVGCKQNTTTTDTTESLSEINIDPLPSWNNGITKDAITAYVKDVTTEGSANYIPEMDRIATFDNDGTLWSEKPAYFQLFFAIDRVKAMANEHPEWKDQQPFKAVLDNDMQ